MDLFHRGQRLSGRFLPVFLLHRVLGVGSPSPEPCADAVAVHGLARQSLLELRLKLEVGLVPVQVSGMEVQPCGLLLLLLVWAACPVRC